MECRGEEGVVFMGVAFRELPGGRSRWRLPQSRDREMQRSTHCGYCVHGTHLLPMDHDRQDVSTPATRCAAGIMVPTEQQCRRVGGLQPRADECRTFYGWPAAVTIECGAHRYPPNPPLGTLRVGLRGPVRRGGCDVAEGAVANSIEDPGGQAGSEGVLVDPSQRCGLLSTWPAMPAYMPSARARTSSDTTCLLGIGLQFLHP
jgi:hypothetical protein